MIFTFDEAQLKHIADVIETENRIRNRLYHELKWNNDWSPSPASRMTRLIKKKGGAISRPTSGKYKKDKKAEYIDDTKGKCRPQSARESRGHRSRGESFGQQSAREERCHKSHGESVSDSFAFNFGDGGMRYKQHTGDGSKLKSFAINIGDKSKRLGIGWKEEPKSFSVDFGHGVQYTSRADPRGGMGEFSIDTPSGGRSFQVQSLNPTNGDSNVVIRTSESGDQRRRTSDHSSKDKKRTKTRDEQPSRKTKEIDECSERGRKRNQKSRDRKSHGTPKEGIREKNSKELDKGEKEGDFWDKAKQHNDSDKEPSGNLN